MPPAPRDNPDDAHRLTEGLGGADAVEKTTYVTGHGTEPERTRGEQVPTMKGSASTGPNTTVWIIGILAVGAVLVYLFGLGR